jgi:hypothetical protein
MTTISVISGLLSIALFWWASEIPEIGLKSTIVGGLGLLLMIASVLTTPAIVGHETCVRYSPIAEEC